MGELETSGTRRSLAERINQAFESLHPADRGPYTNSEVAEWFVKNGDPSEPKISVNYLAALRSGQRDNPTLRHVRALARFFEIPASYFIEDDENADEIFADLQFVAAMRDADVRHIAARAMDLEPSMRSWLRDTVSGLPARADAPASRSRRRRFQAADPDSASSPDQNSAQ